MTVISLMTDFGIKDGNVGVMKGVIWGICPSAQISDLSHMIQPQNIREAAYVFARSVPYFPKGSIHVVVVDPGVGTARRPMAAQIGDWFYVGPDNGTITGLLERAARDGWQTTFIALTEKKYWLDTISHVFHGRDVFSPVAAHVASGVPLAHLGKSFEQPVRLKLPRPEKTQNGWRGEVIHLDHFGSASTNIRLEELGEAMKEMDRITVRLNGSEIHGMVNTFGDRQAGELIALLGSTGNLGIAVVNGSAVQRLGTKVGDAVEVVYKDIPR